MLQGLLELRRGGVYRLDQLLQSVRAEVWCLFSTLSWPIPTQQGRDIPRDLIKPVKRIPTQPLFMSQLTIVNSCVLFIEGVCMLLVAATRRWCSRSTTWRHATNAAHGINYL